VWCGHEYTVKNLEFALAAQKGNAAVAEKLEWARAQRAKGLPTIPSTVGVRGPLMHLLHVRSQRRRRQAAGTLTLLRSLG
jgi:hydroxyacylglutathione hydrolase